MSFKITRAHFHDKTENARPQITEETADVETKGSSRYVVPLTNQGFMQLMKYYPAVVKVADLDVLPDKLTKGNEFGFSPIFDPHIIDECCIRGIFPLTLSIGQGHFIFAPKLHEKRSVCALVDTPDQMRSVKCFPFSDEMEGVFDQKNLQVSKKLTRSRSDASCQASFDVFVNRKEDWCDAVAMMKEQHSDNWLCSPLRKCLYWMLLHPNECSTKIVLTAIRRHKYSANESVVSQKDVINEGDIVAAELGYIVGDVYTSATGAYCVNGAGLLQLAVTGELLKQLGCKIWDLGMQMNYKEKLLGCVEIRRKKWQQMMTEHKDMAVFSSPQSTLLLSELRTGCPVTRFLRGGSTKQQESSVANPESKSQMKKRLRIEHARKRKAEKTVQPQ